MLQGQHKAAEFAGGLDARLVTDTIADELRDLRIKQLFLACDTDGNLKPLRIAIQKLSTLGCNKLRCYVLCAYDGQTLEQAEARLRAVYEVGALPFAQLYQPKNKWIKYPKDWKDLARTWSRPAAMKTLMKPDNEEKYELLSLL